jgi:hypothetical protein
MRIKSCNSGVALAEFALILPLLLLFLLGSLEVSRYALINIKLDRTAATMADLVTQTTQVTQADLESFAEAAPQIMRPFSFNGSSIIFNSVYSLQNPAPPCDGGAGNTCIAWQYRALGTEQSRIGVEGGNATLPGNYNVILGQNIVTAEVFADYSPIIPLTGDLISALAPHTMYKIALFKPRQGNLFNPPL